MMIAMLVITTLLFGSRAQASVVSNASREDFVCPVPNDGCRQMPFGGCNIDEVGRAATYLVPECCVGVPHRCPEPNDIDGDECSERDYQFRDCFDCCPLLESDA